MVIRNYRPTSAGRRAGSVSTNDDLTAKGNNPEKNLLVRRKKSGGRNHHGKITSRHRGGGHKQMYRLIDFRRVSCSSISVIRSIEYDPCRSAHIALLVDASGNKSYILAADGMVVGAGLRASDGGVDPEIGNSMPLSEMPLGLTIHSIELQPGGGAKLCRAAGACAVLSARDGRWAQINLPSGEVRRIPSACRATVGVVGNREHQNASIGKAGRNRWLGIRPSVRGVAMNPVAHPMGGGEGRSSGGRHPCSPTGKLAKGGRTRSRRKSSSKAIVRRRWSKRNGQLVN